MVVLLSCGNVYALPQDWPCFGIQLKKHNIIKETKDNFEYSYLGETDKYIVKINLSGSHIFPTLFANCGTAGCNGIITEKETNKNETLRFFCDEYSKDYTKVACHIGFGGEAYFNKDNKNNFILHYCSDNPEKTLRFNLSDCNNCHCKMYWYDHGIKEKTGNFTMACKNEKNQAHCFTYYGYEEWRNFENKEKDYDNCVGLEL